ncbi:MAG: response regulator transcription factor [Cereibacter sp.]|jgi:DNA-binding NarL/FixJ family response regulator|nr:response regulator transcription factor [Rhodobacter sp.]
MDPPNLPATEDLKILLVTDNTLLGALLSGQFREDGGLSIQITAPGLIEERGLEKIERGTALLLDSNAFNRLYRRLSDVAAHNAVIVIAEQISLVLVRKVLEIGGRGIIPTDFDADLFRMALFMALRGETFFPSSAWLPTLRMSADCDPIGAPSDEDRPLITWREREILNQLFQGISNKLIAYNLGITEATVKMHMSNLSRKLEAQNRTQLLVNAMKRGFVPPLVV